MNRRLSVVVISYNMRREIPRTLFSLSPAMQREIDRETYEVILVNNGPEHQLVKPDADFPVMNLRAVQMQNPTVSPAPAINRGIELASGDLIGVMIDGARLASPGLLISASRAARLHPRPVIVSLGFHLGSDFQPTSMYSGYNQDAEDKLLDSVDWQKDGYRLFDISVFAGSSSKGWFGPISESNAIFLTREMWTELEGFDERFTSPGGGFVNFDTYKRACELKDVQLISLIGEGTFHQFHGGIATNANISPFKEFEKEYVRIRGGKFKAPVAVPWYFGQVNSHVWSSIQHSVAGRDRLPSTGKKRFSAGSGKKQIGPFKELRPGDTRLFDRLSRLWRPSKS